MGDGIDLVTGAFGNTGGAITSLLQARGRTVRTLTGHPPAPRSGPGAAATPSGPAIDVHPLSFDDPADLVAAFDGVETFYNTFWMRTGDGAGYDTAVTRSRLLLDAARRAGVRNVVQLSVVKPSLHSPYPYFRGKAQVEAAARATGLPVTVVRPAVIFGGDSVLLHNLAWVLRRAPVFALAGDGSYRIRPVHLDDVARICVEAGTAGSDDTIDAIGPERPTYSELVTDLRDAIGARTRLVHLPAGVVLAASKVIGLALRDQLLTRDELESTMEGLADSDDPATGTVSLHDWIADHADELGLAYLNERTRRR